MYLERMKKRICKCQRKGKLNTTHIKGCHLYQQEPIINKQIKPQSMSKVTSQKEDSGLNTYDNVSNGDTHNDEALTKRRQRTKKEKPQEDTTENEDKPSKLKDKRKNLGQKKEMSVATGISRSESEILKEDLK